MKAVTADTNIYISGLHFGGVPMRFLDAARADCFRLAASEPLLAEVRRVLHDKFGWSRAAIADAMAQLEDCTTLVNPTMAIAVVAADPDDDRILECAIEAGSDYVVSGDKDLLQLGSYNGIKIIRVADFMTLLSPSWQVPPPLA